MGSRPGDWTCSDCGFNNFASRSACFNCQRPRVVGGLADRSEVGRLTDNPNDDWVCDCCQFVNFARRTSCFSCNAPKKVGGEPEPLDPGSIRAYVESARFEPPDRSGDWICEACGKDNFARRTSCFQCQAPRTAADGTRHGRPREPGLPPLPPPALKPGDWLCALCGMDNFARRDRCFRCDAPRQESRGPDDHPGVYPGGMHVPPPHPVAGGYGGYDPYFDRPDFNPGYEEPLPPLAAEVGVASRYDGYGDRGYGPPTLPPPAEDSYTAGGDPGVSGYGGYGAAGNERYDGYGPGCEYGAGEVYSDGFGRGGYEGYGDVYGRGAGPLRRPGGPASPRPGDWICSTCGKNNFSFRTVCFVCNKPRGDQAGGISPPIPRKREVRPGDWMCPQCHVNNFSFRTKCFTCGKFREEVEAPSPKRARIQDS